MPSLQTHASFLAAVTTCPPGTGGFSCSQCPIGTWSTGGSWAIPTPACTSCLAGTTTAALGATSSAACLKAFACEFTGPCQAARQSWSNLQLTTSSFKCSYLSDGSNVPSFTVSGSLGAGRVATLTSGGLPFNVTADKGEPDGCLCLVGRLPPSP